MEDQDERTGVRGDAGPRQQGEQHRQRTNIEDQNTVNNLIGGFRNALLRIIRFRGGDPHQLQAAKGEHNDRHHHHQPVKAVRQEAPLVPQVTYRRLRAAVAAEQQPAAEQNHRHYGDHFDNREPEFHFTEHFNIGQVNGVDGDEEDRRRGPGRDFRPPELDIFANGGQFRHGHQDIQYPVVPAGGEAGKTAPVFVSKVAK